MSQFSTMTSREMKMQAAAICREVHAMDDFQMDFGKKMSVPKDIMLEELSLASNRGSRLFKMRQRRSEKYTFESIQNENNAQLNNRMVSQFANEDAMVANDGKENGGTHLPSDASFDTKATPDQSSIAPGYGGPLRDIPPEKFNSTAVPKSYHSPWEQAIINNPALVDTLTTRMPEIEPQVERPGYKSFNRVATPFGGFNKTPKPLPDTPLQVEPPLDLPAAQGDGELHRPSFNRSALGWVSTGGTVTIPTACPQRVLIPESEDL